MELGGWEKQSTDVVRVRRLAVGYLVGAMLVTSTLAVVAATAAKAYGLDQQDDVVEAAIVDSPDDDPKVEQAPEPEQKPQDNPKPKGLRQLVQPTKIDDKLVEKEPVPTDNPYASEDPYALLDNAAKAPEAEKPKAMAAPVVVHKTKPKPVRHAPAGPISVTEDVTPPRPISMMAPSYPAAAKAAGIEGTVVVRYVVTASGAVTSVQAVRGPAELRAACEAAVRGWRFMPALKDGQPVAVHRIARFPFRIKT